MKCICPNCDQPLLYGEDLAGMTVNCPSCDSRMTLPEPDVSAQADSARGSARKKTTGARKQTWTDNTNVSMWMSGLIGLVLSAAFLLLLLPFRNMYFGQLFFARGWVPFALVLLMFWSIGFLFLKTRVLASQKNALLIDLLPESIGEEIDVETVDKFLEHVNGVPAKLRSSFMVNRIKRGLEHFSVRHSNPEVANIMMAQSEQDAAAVHSSYSVVKVFLWAIPILGFIGTVQGISGAVGGFSGALDDAQSIEVMKESLNDVTSGLALAFDTTLVALIMSLMVSFPVNILQKREEDFLGMVDTYCSENFLKRLNDAGGLADVATHTQVMMQALGNAMASNEGALLNELKESQERLAGLQEELSAQADEHRRTVEADLATMVANVQQSVGTMAGEISKLVDAQIRQSSQSAEEHQKRMEELVAQISDPLDETAATAIENLVEGLENLNTVLGELNGKQVVVKKEVRRGLFGGKS